VYLTTIMGRKAKQKSKYNAKTENDPREVANDKTTEQYVFHDKEYQVSWHKSVQDLPRGQIIKIPYLKQLAARDVVPFAYCKNGDIDIVTNFVPAYLHRITRRLWELMDEEDYVLSTHNWDEGKDSVLNLFGTSMQHPEEKFVHYFGGTPVAVIEQGSLRCSPRKKKPEQGSPTSPPRNNPDVIGQQREESLNNPASEATVVGTLSPRTETDGEEEPKQGSLTRP
jgi:hypothetical protein